MTTLSKSFNETKLKVKYILGIHSVLPDYPTAEDITYELLFEYCSKSWKHLKFTDVSMQKRWNLTDTKLSKILTELRNDGLITEIRDTSGYTTYEFIKNPYS